MMEVAGAQSGSFTGSHGKRLAITVGQTGSAAITSRAQRIARARQSATATATGSVSASKRARQRQAARVGRALPRTFAVAQDQTAAVGVRRASVVYAAGPQAVGLLARADRTFASAQASGTLVSFVLPGRLFSAEQAQRTWLEWPKVPARIDVTGEADGLVVTLHPEMTTRSTSPAISVAGRADGVAITGRTPGRSSSGAGRVVVTAKVRRPVVENVGEIVVSERRNVETQVRPSGRIAVKEERP